MIYKKEIFLDWAEKYRPRNLSQIVGNTKALDELKTWSQLWLDGIPNEKAIALHGRAGIGKTTAAHALASDMDWEIVELNASDQRTADIIDRIVGLASINNTFDDRKRLIIVDEADNIHGTADKGGEKAIIEIIKKTSQPMILIANDFYDMSPGLRNSCRSIKFYPIMVNLIVHVLKRIAEDEGISYEEGALENLATFANGDMRSAINDLQAIAQKKSILKVDIRGSGRNKEDDNFKLVARILKGNNIIDAYNTSQETNEDPDEFIQWIDENVPLVLTSVNDLNNVYYYLSRASIFLGRVNRRQDYNMWKFASMMMTAGIVVSHSRNKNLSNLKLNYPSIRQKLKSTKNMRYIRDSIAKKIGAYCHVSIYYARSKLIPFFKILVANDQYASSISVLLGLESEEMAFLIDSEDDNSEKIQKIYKNNNKQNIQSNDYENSDKTIINEKNNQISKSQDKDKSQSSIFDFW